ncbi:MAG: nucleotidyltransferase family protein [Hydrogenophaga sp.]|jgi:molybdenum cofactor cytidylyltransferase|uniref:nucleotidyltransferase family protein n=1 Tax=Hydrogenophaga sp. TaxID=1904254 RepID=UPI00271A9B04|nr:nucleotidyltransferase family protein [Hydrogenophaga sp.]MDO9482725.1 nucleotidyltransferase family protein [Hydrogenophaga sp.]MDO9567980.1 nucleotidyltransferase family protein [Hydrogenophaga sp.]MDP2095165.1 nucleotidyltransferase family protein [Hydrogenophaga sp.]MDP2221291.1 nucleotidyltransferase family protein [Hydrogenophaga sp.]MDP3925914.1 nucleotidyltransferase family protein [Hydrogenophaga sp.]
MNKMGALSASAIVLAAGSGSRMGNRPKSLLELNGMTLIEQQIKALVAAGVHPLVVVLGHHAAHIARALHPLGVNFAHNPNPGPDPVSSLRIGLQALPSTVDAVLVALADQPLITSHDITDLMCAYTHRPAGTHWVQPEVDGLPGNPVMFSGEVRQQILAADAGMGGPQWRNEHPEQVHRWNSPNAHYRTDIDTPEDIKTLAARTGHHLRWPADWTEAPT